MLNSMALYWPQGWKNDTIKSGKPICNPWGPIKSQNISSKVFLALTPDVKWGLWSHKLWQNDPKRMSPNWLNVAGCDVLSTEGAKVSNRFVIGQHNGYFTDYRNQNKSSQKAGVAGWRKGHHSRHHAFTDSLSGVLKIMGR